MLVLTFGIAVVITTSGSGGGRGGFLATGIAPEVGQGSTTASAGVFGHVGMLASDDLGQRARRDPDQVLETSRAVQDKRCLSVVFPRVIP